MQRSIVVSACGSSIGLEVLKSLREAGRTEKIIGTEVSWCGEEIARRWCDDVIILPRGEEPEFPAAMQQLLHGGDVALAFINTEPELEAISAIRSQIKIPLSCPPAHQLAFCLDKKVLHDHLQADPETAALVAATCLVETREQLAAAAEQLGLPLWLRCATGPRGRGSILVERVSDGWFWIDYWARRDGAVESWLAHEYLPGRNLNWTSIWRDGQLVMSSTGQRLSYFLAQVAISGITGNVSHCRLVNGGLVNEVARRVIESLPGTADGIYAVDLREDKHGQPRVTEINGRCAFRPLLYTRGGANFPAAFAALMLDNQRPAADAQQDAAAAGWEMHRGMDFEPLFRFSPE